MWCKLESRVSSEHIQSLVERIGSLGSGDEGEEFFHKEFFSAHQDADENQDILKAIHLDVWPEIGERAGFDKPVVDHASLLIKRVGGAATGLHQDRAYWETRETKPTLFSVWIALETMTEEKGGLMLFGPNQVDATHLSSFNQGSLFPHEYVEHAPGEFPLLIAEPIAPGVKQSMEFVALEGGEALAFDSFEPHMTGPNQDATPRLAMKIAYCEGSNKARYLISTDELEGCA